MKDMSNIKEVRTYCNMVLNTDLIRLPTDLLKNTQKVKTEYFADIILGITLFKHFLCKIGIHCYVR